MAELEFVDGNSSSIPEFPETGNSSSRPIMPAFAW
eukprot:CAMPEP_0175083302 /NCGR_PEP_ID=MMETSP0052_2-20121109/27296_1 /TAXON_ID=51329 ORGANISM="Polytomella parva, Strain SAG 63-3" /NCGR_SAMPLE_ID=MMETSP0052_2 /ASSEMBLY_ACC=CAM_ASM_000194 /LENGTH=34 /DNA_ID= /DNA_START= /DNA_END= /DNA_ORIENTATION=